MSFCEHMMGSDSSQSTNQKTQDEKLNIQNELVWGLTYRNYKENEKNQPIRPIHSPIDIPFKLCRAELMARKSKRFVKSMEEEEPDDRRGDGKGTGKSHSGKMKTTKKRKISKEKPSLLERSIWSQSKYMDFLSIPNPKFGEPGMKKYKLRCELEPCPPRFVQLAVPNKRKVFANWKEYAHFLPTEMLMRYEEILHTDQNLEPREARYYYKKLDRQKRKVLKEKKRLENKKKKDKQKDSDWQKTQIDMLAKDIVDYIKDEPLFTLNYKQMLLSDGILERLEKTNIMKKPSRKTKKYYKKTVIEVADKFAIWIDTLTRFVDVQAIESDEDIPPLSISSLSAEGEGEGSSEYESSSEDELRDDQLFGKEDAIWGEEGAGEGALAVEDVMKDIFKVGEGEDAQDFEDMLRDLDEDILAKLIAILSNCSDDFLNNEIDYEKMPGVRYIDVLNKLKALKRGMQEDGGKPYLEQVMIDWALRNDPDKVDDALLKKIHDVAGLLGDWMLSGKQDDYTTDRPSDIPTGEEGIGFGGENLEEQGIGGIGGEGGIGAHSSNAMRRQIGEDMGGGMDLDEDLENIMSKDTGAGTEGGEGEDKGQSTDAVEGSDIGVATDGKSHSAGTFMEGDYVTTDDAEGGLTTPGDTSVFLDGEDESALGYGFREVKSEHRKLEEGAEVDILYEQGKAGRGEAEGLEGRIIKGHKPPKVFEHSPDTVCCLSLKTWAVWLLEITHNAHSWTQWMSCVIQKVREYASIVRGDVKLPNGETKVLRKAEWRDFIKETEENVVAWRQYSSHVKDLSQSIVENFHGKEVNCCPKCLQDHLIKNVVVAHDTLQALTEAISCAAYWQRCLDTLVEKTCNLAQTKKDADEEDSSEESDGDVELEEIKEEESGESIYEIEGMETNPNNNETPKKE